jgi:hypothetical protein
MNELTNIDLLRLINLLNKDNLTRVYASTTYEQQEILIKKLRTIHRERNSHPDRRNLNIQSNSPF